MAIFMIGFLAAAGFGCRGTPSANSTSGPELAVGLESNPTSLDPRVALDAAAMRIFPLIFEGLFELDQNSEPQPRLVESYTRPDPLTYVFHLRSGHRCPDGTELSARDVVFTVSSLADPELRSPTKYLFDKIAELAAPDDHTVRIRLKEPYAPFLTELNLAILPAAAVKKDPQGFFKKPFGSGPYQVAEFDPGGAVALAVNPNYHGPRPALARIVFRVIPDDVTRVLALERGEVSLLLNSTPPDDLTLLEQNPKFKIINRPGVNYVYLGFNLEDPILGKLAVRKAIAHALDRQKLISCLLRDTVSPATGLLAPSHWAYNPHVEQYGYDPALAKSLLDQAGFPDPDGDGPLPRFRLVFKTSQAKLGRWTAEAMSDQFRQVGIAVEVRSYEWGTYFADIKAGKFQLYSLTWVGTADPDVYYFLFHSESRPPHGANRNRYRSPDFDRLAEQGRSAIDRGERRLIYGQIQELVARDLPSLSLWYNNNIVVMDKRLAGFVIYPSGDFRSLAGAAWQQGNFLNADEEGLRR